MSPREKKRERKKRKRERPGFHPSQHLWKCSRITTTKSTCQRPAHWTSSPRLNSLRLFCTNNELLRKAIFSLKQTRNKLKRILVCAYDVLSVLVSVNQPKLTRGFLQTHFGLCVQAASARVEFGSEGPQKSVCLLGSLFTFLRVILAPWGEQSRRANMSLGLVSVQAAGAVAAPRHLGGR